MDQYRLTLVVDRNVPSKEVAWLVCFLFSHPTLHQVTIMNETPYPVMIQMRYSSGHIRRRAPKGAPKAFNKQRFPEITAPDGIVVSADINAAGFFVDMVGTKVALHDVVRGPFLDIHTLDAVRDGVALYQVVDAVVGRFVVDQLYGSIGPSKRNGWHYHEIKHSEAKRG